jgi:hypothetical protein
MATADDDPVSIRVRVKNAGQGVDEGVNALPPLKAPHNSHERTVHGKPEFPPGLCRRGEGIGIKAVQVNAGRDGIGGAARPQIGLHVCCVAAACDDCLSGLQRDNAFHPPKFGNSELIPCGRQTGQCCGPTAIKVSLRHPTEYQVRVDFLCEPSDVANGANVLVHLA